MDTKGFYLLFNTRKSELVALSDDYELLIKFMTVHAYVCRHCVVRQVKRKEFEKAMMRYDEYYITEIEDIAIRQKDVTTFMSLKDDESANLINTAIGLKRLGEWSSLKKKERETINNAINIIFKYIDDDQKMLKKSGISDICSDIDYLDQLHELNNKY